METDFSFSPHSPSQSVPTALTIAGSDPTGGADIQADLRAFSALSVYGVSAITALTAQNTRGVREIFALSSLALTAQLEALFQDIRIDAVKIGMLHQKEKIEVVAQALKRYGPRPMVLDPVLSSKNGRALLDADAIESLKSQLIPLSTLLTPNLHEASILLKRRITYAHEMEEAASELLRLGAQSVLLKGGHLGGSHCDDCLVSQGRAPIWFRAKRIITENHHGTGCVLSSAIAANLAKDLPMEDAIAQAKSFLSQALDSGKHLKVGDGIGPAFLG